MTNNRTGLNDDKRDDQDLTRSEACEALDDIPSNPQTNETIGDLIIKRYGRREVLQGALYGTATAVSAVTSLMAKSAFDQLAAAPVTPAESGITPRLAMKDQLENQPAADRFSYPELSSGVDHTHHVADGYNADILLRWGDPIFANGPQFDPYNQTAANQLKQFGYNNDYVGFIPLDDTQRTKEVDFNEKGKQQSGLLCVNHEFTNEEVMFPGLGNQNRVNFADMTQELVDTEMAAHGGTVVEIERRKDGSWRPVLNSKYNRRISPLTTEMAIDGDAAGHTRLQTNTDPTGRKVIGTLNNCAGGITPWGTYLMAEENFHFYFWTDNLDEIGRPVISGPEAKSKKRYKLPSRFYAWGKFHDRFNIDKEPNESNRFGWIVEVDPFDRESTPVKHTSLGRFSHEGAEVTQAKDGRVVIYSGDDNKFDYVYKFISKNKISEDRKANKKLLSEGTLYVAKFHQGGKLEWLPLIYDASGKGPLSKQNGFNSQGDVLIDARLAGDALGATPMDRPEDIQPDGKGRAFLMLTNNNKRKASGAKGINAANPRPKNSFGHVIELIEDEGDHGALTGCWDLFLLCGDPSLGEVGAKWHPETSSHGWFGAPDNCAIDSEGRLWIATDQGRGWSKTGKSDGLYGIETEGEKRGKSKLFFRVPIGAELCGPYFTPDQETLFLAIQHPGTDGTKDFPGFNRKSTFEDPATRWPDFNPNHPPRPSVMVIRKQGGGTI